MPNFHYILSKTKRITSHPLILCLVIWLCLLPFSGSQTEAKTSPYRQGLEYYVRGEFDKSIQQLLLALDKKPRKREKIAIHKFLGLSYYTLGKRVEAQRAFETCLSLSISCQISAKEALDESVVPFFQSLRQLAIAKKNAPKPKTLMLIKSNAKNAEVLLDGILLGPTNKALVVKPGILDIMVQAKGYQSRITKISITKNLENVFDIQLKQISPPTAPPRLVEKPPPKKSKIPDKKPTGKDSSFKGGLDLFGEEEKEELASKPPKASAKISDTNPKLTEKPKDAVLQKKAKKAKILNQKIKKNKKVLEELKDDIADAKKEKRKLDKAIESEDLTIPEELGPEPAKEAAAPLPPTLSKKSVSILHFLPFGSGQFYNGDYFLGAILAGAQAYAIGVVVEANQDISLAKKDALQAQADAEKDNTISPENLQAFLDDNTQFIAAKQKRQQQATQAFAGLYVFSLLHGLIDRPYVIESKDAKQALTPNYFVQVGAEPEGSWKLQLHWDF